MAPQLSNHNEEHSSDNDLLKTTNAAAPTNSTGVLAAVDSDDSDDIHNTTTIHDDDDPQEQHPSKIVPHPVVGSGDTYDLSDDNNNNNNISSSSKNNNGIVKNNNNDVEQPISNDSNTQRVNEASLEKPQPTLIQKMISFYWTYEFLILVVLAILLARAYPPLGAIYLYPKITASWIAVIFIFFMSGLSLKTESLRDAFILCKFNTTIQIHQFIWCSLCGYGLGNFLKITNIVENDMANGIIICSCLPITVSMAIALTAACNGDIAAAVFNTASSNMAGVFVSPGLIFLYLQEGAHADVGYIFWTLTCKIIVPVIVGQIVRNLIYPIAHFFNTNKYFFKQCQTYALVFIIYTVFSKKFLEGRSGTLGDVFIMILFQFLLMIWLMTSAWFLLKQLFPNHPKLRATGLYLCTHKSIANGIPLITAVYGKLPAAQLATYTLPILIWHPMSLMVGTIITPKLTQFIINEQKRLHLDEDDNPIIDSDNNNNDNVIPVDNNIITAEDDEGDNTHPAKYTPIPNNPFDEPYEGYDESQIKYSTDTLK